MQLVIGRLPLPPTSTQSIMLFDLTSSDKVVAACNFAHRINLYYPCLQCRYTDSKFSASIQHNSNPRSGLACSHSLQGVPRISARNRRMHLEKKHAIPRDWGWGDRGSEILASGGGGGGRFAESRSIVRWRIVEQLCKPQPCPASEAESGGWLRPQGITQLLGLEIMRGSALDVFIE